MLVKIVILILVAISILVFFKSKSETTKGIVGEVTKISDYAGFYEERMIILTPVIPITIKDKDGNEYEIRCVTNTGVYPVVGSTYKFSYRRYWNAFRIELP